MSQHVTLSLDPGLATVTVNWTEGSGACGNQWEGWQVRGQDRRASQVWAQATVSLLPQGHAPEDRSSWVLTLPGDRHRRCSRGVSHSTLPRDHFQQSLAPAECVSTESTATSVSMSSLYPLGLEGGKMEVERTHPVAGLRARLVGTTGDSSLIEADSPASLFCPSACSLSTWR